MASRILARYASWPRCTREAVLRLSDYGPVIPAGEWPAGIDPNNYGPWQLRRGRVIGKPLPIPWLAFDGAKLGRCVFRLLTEFERWTLINAEDLARAYGMNRFQLSYLHRQWDFYRKFGRSPSRWTAQQLTAERIQQYKDGRRSDWR